MLNKLLGGSILQGTSYASANYILMQRIYTGNYGVLKNFYIYSHNAGKIKLAVYADDNGTPTTRISRADEFTASATSWNTIPADRVYININQYYWIASIVDTYATASGRYLTTYTYMYKAQTYSGFTFPESAGSGYTTFAGYTISMALYGDDSRTIAIVT